MTNHQGFSFTTMFFGPFPMLFRGDYGMAGALILIFIFSLIPYAGMLALPLFFIAPAVVNRVWNNRHQGLPAEVFPMQPTEIKHAVIYFLVWIISIVFLASIGAAVVSL